MGDIVSWKTTLLNSIAGLHREFTGNVTLDDKLLTQYPPGTVAYVQQGALDILP